MREGVYKGSGDMVGDVIELERVLVYGSGWSLYPVFTVYNDTFSWDINIRDVIFLEVVLADMLLVFL